ncbi:hypothetical protein CYMTET_31589 [Cymbomonas tetramitiformis]|uniref:Uncharacterized protein n=1 Tax=Cymbomonas tetramitiformis TaxID=36881 RepID=A0AAE0KT35_9CHLO|nr:hypothetical protein CYMTET_31589 [Cymbomonas tetramitiformis]
MCTPFGRHTPALGARRLYSSQCQYIRYGLRFIKCRSVLRLLPTAHATSSATTNFQSTFPERVVTQSVASTPAIHANANHLITPVSVGVVSVIFSIGLTLIALVIKALWELIAACQSASRASVEVEIAAQAIVKACAAVESTCARVDLNIARAETFGEKASGIAESVAQLPSTASRSLLQLLREKDDVCDLKDGSMCLGASVPGERGPLGWRSTGASNVRLIFSSRHAFRPGEYVGVPGIGGQYTWGIVDFSSSDEADTVLSCPWPPPKDLYYEDKASTKRWWSLRRPTVTYRVIVSLDGDEEATYRELTSREIGKYVAF